MWITGNDVDSPILAKGFYTPPAKSKSIVPAKAWMSERKQSNSHVSSLPPVPSGHSPYVKAKHVQLIEKDPERAVSLFWSAINSGDRVDSALKDMAVVMKQLNRSDEAIEAIKSFRHLCSPASQESLDNVLVELYKRSGRLEDQILILQHKLKLVEEGNGFGGKRMKLARSAGKKVHITVEQEYARLLGNLAWVYLQLNDYQSAEQYYRKALSIEADRNKQCNLAVCLIYTNRITEAKFLLQVIRDSAPRCQMDESYAKSFERASELLAQVESQPNRNKGEAFTPCSEKQETSWKTTTYTPTVPARGFPGSPLTQPRGEPVLPYSESWRKGMYGNEDDPSNRLHRKLQFENPSCWGNQDGKNPGVECQVNGVHKEKCEGQNSWKTANNAPTVRAGGLPRSPFTQPRGGSVLPDSGGWRKGIYGNDLVNPLHRKQFESPQQWGSQDRKIPDAEAQENPANKGYDGNDKVNSFNCKGTDEIPRCQENDAEDKENDGDAEDLPIWKGKISWADMVEEDEKEQLMMSEILGDQNTDPQLPTESLSSMFQSFGLSEQHPSARRSLAFSQEEKEGAVQSKRGARLKVFCDITPP